jgi:hypothetical protein
MVGSMGKADPEKVQKVQNLQMKAAKKYHEIPPLCQLLLERRVINEGEMLALLKKEEKNGRGPLYIGRKLLKPTLETTTDRLRQMFTLRDTRVRNALIILALFAVGLGIWRWQAAGSDVHMFVKCRHCYAISEVPWAQKFPVQCPNCGNTRAYYAMICENGHVFTVEDPLAPHRCPETGSSRVHPLTAEEARKLKAEEP